jgi:uncharacterized membrane protein
MATIRNPGEWTYDSLVVASRRFGALGRALRGDEAEAARPPRVRTVTTADLRAALAEGFDDFLACRADVVFLCVAYPLAGLAAVGLASNAALLPLLFPAIAGLSIVGPAVAVGLYEFSRRRERGEKAGWADAFRVLASPSIGAVIALGVVVFALFALWLGFSQALYALTLGPEPPASLGAFAAAVVGSPAGWVMTVVGLGVGFLFAAVTLSISVVSFPLMLDRDVGVLRAVLTSVEVVRRNPRTMAIWGLIVAGALVAGSAPLFLGLAVVMPVLGHATWRLYRRAVA